MVCAAGAPPGIELTVATAIDSPAGRRPQGPIPAWHQPCGLGGSSGDACRAPVAAPDLVQPIVPIVSIPNSLATPAFGSHLSQTTSTSRVVMGQFQIPEANDRLHGEQASADDDIYSFLAGPRPRVPAEQGLPAGGLVSPRSASMAAPAMSQSSAMGRGAAPITSESSLLSAAVDGMQHLQPRTPPPSASMAAPSMA